ncbi:MAG: AMP-binding protein, partial [Chlamydiota bacterium]|nr:AMP-binding protein [Chlamydiota bacterium]
MKPIPCPIIHHAKLRGKEPAIITGSKVISYVRLEYLISSCINRLRVIGIRKGSRIGIIADSDLDQMITIFALWRIQATACLFSPRDPIERLQKQCQKTGCKILFVPPA